MSKIFKELGFLDKPAEIRSKVLPLDKFELFIDMDKKELVPEKMEGFIKEAEKFLEEDVPFMTLYEYRLFKITGDRKTYQTKSHKRRNMLFALMMAEHYEGKGRFLSKLCDVIWAILEETSWVIPAHAAHNQTNPTADVPCVYDEETMHGIDLYTGVTSSLLAGALICNREALRSVSPIIEEKIIYEIKKRFIIPYLSHHPAWSGEYGGKVNNWCPWIVSNVLFVTAVLEENDYDRASVVLRAMKHLDNYTNCIPEDGGCDEGPGYWGAAGASLFDCCETLYDLTGGYVDVFSHPHLRAIGEYEVKVNINDDRFVNYGDAGSRFYPDGYLLVRFGRRTGSEMMEAYGRMVTRKTPTAYPGNQRFYRAYKDLMMAADMDAETTKAPTQIWFPNLKTYITRESEDTSKGMFLALKGGCNGESHNHNDVGHFIIYYNGEPVIIDPGTVEYTRDTFGKNRYTIWAMQSHYHNLPAFDGFGERNGREYMATREVFDEAAGKASLGLETAYEKSAGVVSFTRTASIEDGEAVIKDDIVLDQEREIDFRLMTHVEPKIIEDGKVALAEGRTLVYDKSLTCEVETFDPVKADTMKHWGTPVLYRIHLSCRAKEFHGEMRFI